MKKTIGVLAHVDAGKTTFSEQLLYYTKTIKQRGRVDHQDAFLDSHEIEKQRGITVFADQAIFSIGDSIYHLIDTPGHVDFSPEMERGIQILDYAIIIISAVEGIEGHTETVWELLRKYKIPTFFFINKVDRVGANVSKVIEEISGNLTKDVFEITGNLHQGVMNEVLIEFIAERDEDLLNYYFENGYNHELWLAKMRDMIRTSKIFPCSYGSALQDIGIQTFIEHLEQLTFTTYSSDVEFAGRIYKIRHDQNGTRITFIKALGGTLKVRDEITYWYSEEEITEKVTQLRVYNGSKFKVVDQVEAGELFAVIGISHLSVGDKIGSFNEDISYDMIPTLKSKVSFLSPVNIKEALHFFNMLDAEDPSLNVTWDETLQEIHIHVMGKIQLEVLEHIVAERFQLKVMFEEPEIVYRETINNKVVGYGHFEPLGHYAEVHLKIEPGERNTGIHFENECHTDDLTVGNQNLIRRHLFERNHHGLLTGAPLTDVKITLLTGRAHNKHTSGGDFREATFRALRQGLEKAENILIEPFYHFKIKVNIEQMGKVLSDLQKAHGRYEPPMTEGTKTVITGVVPVSTFMNYPEQLASFTQGKGSISLVFAGYDVCHNEQDVIEKINYNKATDPLYTSSSIFCAKGQGFTVKWKEAQAYMHCK